jgi:hypothetical protein
MIAILTQILALAPTLFGSFERFVSERAATQGESEGESLRAALAMSDETKKMFVATLAKARAKMGATAKTAAKPMAVADAPPLTRAQVAEVIALLQKVHDELPADA